MYYVNDRTLMRRTGSRWGDNIEARFTDHVLAERVCRLLNDKPALGERSEPPTALLGEAATTDAKALAVQLYKFIDEVTSYEKNLERAKGMWEVRSEITRWFERMAKNAAVSS